MGMLAGLGGLFGGGGLSAIGSIFSAFSSLMGQQSPDVPMPPPVDTGTPTPTPEIPANPATVLSPSEQTAIGEDASRRRAQAQAKTDPYTTKLAGDIQEDPRKKNTTLLGS